MRVERVRPLDLALVALALLLLGSALHEADRDLRYGSAITAIAVLLQLLRSWREPLVPVAAFVTIAIGMQVAPEASGPMFVALLAVFGVSGTARTRRAAVLGWLAGVVALGLAMLGNPFTEGASDIALTLTFCTIVWGAGLLVSERGRQARSAKQQVSLLESRRALDVAEATAHERNRIAGELHDVVSHGLSIVIVQTVAARMALQDLGDAVDESVERRLAAVEETAREGLADMRRLLELLGPDGAEGAVGLGEPQGAGRHPGPSQVGAPSSGLGLAQVPLLAARAREAGLEVETVLVGGDHDLPAGLDTTAYRIVQEALTNVLRHAPGAPTTITVARTADTLSLAVVNGSATRPAGDHRGAGYGLVGMRQRVQLYGGRLRVGPTTDGFEVAAEFALERVA